jgi:hypothetical protein
MTPRPLERNFSIAGGAPGSVQAGSLAAERGRAQLLPPFVTPGISTKPQHVFPRLSLLERGTTMFELDFSSTAESVVGALLVVAMIAAILV